MTIARFSLQGVNERESIAPEGVARVLAETLRAIAQAYAGRSPSPRPEVGGRRQGAGGRNDGSHRYCGHADGRAGQDVSV
jgi:hypothetical protein